MNRPKTFSLHALFFSVALLFLSAGCGGDDPVSPSGGGFSADEAVAALDSVADAVIAISGVENAVFLVDAPGEDFSWTAARGLADPAAGDSMTADLPFRIASVSKIFTAALVLDLVEEGLLGLDDSLGALLDSALFPEGYAAADLHSRSGVRSGGAITVRRLLNHTSGMRDYIFDGISGTGGAPGSLIYGYAQDILTTGGAGVASTRWTPEELFAFYLTSGLSGAALFPPGEGFHYSNTNYMILGHVVEAVTGNTFDAELRSRIIEPLGLADTYLEYRETAVGESPAHHFFDLRRLGGPNIDVIGMGIDTSLEWGCGGMVSTAGDLARFLRELVEGRLFDHPSTLQAMFGWVGAGGGDEYGLGVRRGTAAGVTVIGHGGFWGARAAYIPEWDVVVVFAVNQAFADLDVPLEDMVSALRDAGL
ncbi:MAG: beta-lactamase family protein [Candidatus Eisenbacteria bacterium]|nr:beta-lactamase family protein [Candidatus Eisenbacteria bacterium]